MRAIEDPMGALGEAIRFGRVASVDLEHGTCVVSSGDVDTHEIRWIENRAGATRTWSPPSIGEQVLLLCPEGDVAGAVALRGIHSDAHPPAGNTLREILGRFADGAELAYDPEAHRLEITLGAGGVLAIVAPGGMAIEGDVEVTGTVTASEDVKAGDVSLAHHTHGGVQAGGAETDEPS